MPRGIERGRGDREGEGRGDREGERGRSERREKVERAFVNPLSYTLVV